MLFINPVTLHHLFTRPSADKIQTIQTPATQKLAVLPKCFLLIPGEVLPALGSRPIFLSCNLHIENPAFWNILRESSSSLEIGLHLFAATETLDSHLTLELCINGVVQDLR